MTALDKIHRSLKDIYMIIWDNYHFLGRINIKVLEVAYPVEYEV